MLHPDYPFWSVVSLIAVLLPVPWHWRARNVATLALIGWVVLANLVVLINTIAWADHYRDFAPGWCDFSGRILQCIPYAVPACSLAQMRRLESVASTRRSVISASERTRRIWLEAITCVAFPLLMLPLLYVVQGHRYDIIESIGCSIPTYFSWPGIAIRFLLPLVISTASLIYARLAVRWFLVRRLQFRTILASSETGLNVSRYLRLIALAVCDVSVLVAQDVVGITTSFADSQIRPYRSFKSVHEAFGRISQFPEALQTPVSHAAFVVGLYVGPLYSIIFFIFFGLGEEAITEYTSAYKKVSKLCERIGLKSKTPDDVQQQRYPTLGSKTVSTSGRPLSSNVERASAVDDNSDICMDDMSPSADHEYNGGGIPILVERSVV